MKKALKTLLAIATAISIIYGVAVFVSLEPNPVKWEEFGRITFSLVAVFSSLLAVVIVNDDL